MELTLSVKYAIYLSFFKLMFELAALAYKELVFSTESWDDNSAALDECCMVRFARGALQLTEKNRMELVQKQLLETKKIP